MRLTRIPAAAAARTIGSTRRRKYHVSFNDAVHLARALYKFNGSDGAANTFVQVDIGGEYAGLSVDAYYSEAPTSAHHGGIPDRRSIRQTAVIRVCGVEFPGSDRLGQYDLFAHGVVQLRSAQILRRLHAHPLCQSGGPVERRIPATSAVTFSPSSPTTPTTMRRRCKVYWTDVPYTVARGLELTAAYYGYRQNAYGTGTSGGLLDIRA